MNRKEELLREIQALEKELNAISEAERKEESKSLVGRYFKYRNSYSCPSPDEYWWVYRKVTKLDEYGDPLVWEFQKTIRGEIEIVNDSHYFRTGWTEIDAIEFYVAWHELTTEIGKMA